MKKTHLTRGENPRLMYIENKDGEIDGAGARNRRGHVLEIESACVLPRPDADRIPGGGVSGNFLDVDTGEEFWVFGVKSRGSNTHPAVPCSLVVDDDAREAYAAIRAQ